jgi:filamentous hemagglutinin family protein
VTAAQSELSIRTTVQGVLAPLMFGCVLLTATVAGAQTLPTGGNVTHGAATIGSPQNGTLNINQSSNSAIINWSSFSVGAGGTVNFNQPGASSATLNRVTGDTPSSIAGRINAPGTVMLVNPNGIAITKSGVINTGSFAASTLDIKNEDFLAGKYKFTGNGSSATVTNAGRINVSDGGFAALLGGRVANDGVISARLGKVGLGSGELITLDLSGDGFLSVAVPSNQLGNLRDGTGKALVTNRGKIRADGGTVVLSAATAANILRDAVHVPGSIRANSVGTRNGRIVLGGGPGGRVTVSGRVTASGKARTQTAQKKTGGTIDISGAEIALTGAKVDVSGAAGDGKIRIGGDALGQGDFPRAQTVSIDSASVIRADALEQGNGGTIIVWSDGLTSVSGAFSARGGASGGNGGLIETSGKYLEFTGVRVDASAPKGKTGEWLLDPVDLTVDQAAANTISNNLNSTNVTLLTTASSASGPGIQSAGNGDIVINGTISWSSGTTLTLNAYNDIRLNAALAGSSTGTLVANARGSFVVNGGGQLVLGSSAITAGGDIVFYASPGQSHGKATYVAGGRIIIDGNTNSFTTADLTSGGDIYLYATTDLGTRPTVNAGGRMVFEFNGAVTTSGGGTFNARTDLYVSKSIQNNNGGLITLRADAGATGTGSVYFASGATVSTSGTVNILYNPSSYSDPFYFPAITGLTAYKLVNTVDQFAALGNYSGASAVFALGKDLDFASSIAPIGTFSGVLDGFGHAILNPVMNTDGSNRAALIMTNNGTIRNFGVVGGSFSANTADAAGMVHTNNGTLSNVFSTASVSSNTGDAGGLVTINNGTINGGSWAGGSVRGAGYVGGLVGKNGGDVYHSYATGNVTNGNTVGGLVGYNGVTGRIQYAYALGSVHGDTAGGLVGENDWTSSGAGRNGYSSIQRGGGWISDTWAAGAVTGNYKGGIVGNNEYDKSSNNVNDFNSNIYSSARVVYSYWDAGTTGQSNYAGLSYAQTNSQFSSEQVQYVTAIGGTTGFNPFKEETYANFKRFNYGAPQFQDAGFAGAWYIVEGKSRPFLKAEYSPYIQNTHQLQLMNMNATSSYKVMRNIDAHRELGSGMWVYGFSAVAPIATTDVTVEVYRRTQLGEPRTTETSSRDGNVVRIYVTVYGIFPNTDYSQIQRYHVTEYAGSEFNGKLDGQGYEISNIWGSYANNNAGLFDTIGLDGVVKNIGIFNPWFSTTYGHSGAIAGTNYGTISGAYSRTNGNVTNIYTDFGSGGGLVGFNKGTISQSYSNLYVAGIGEWPSGTFNPVLGGLVGMNSGTIRDAYSTGYVSGNGVIGGLVGENYGTIANAYVATALARIYPGWGLRAGGTIAGIANGSITNTYYNSQVTGDPGSATSFTWTGTPLTTAQMQDINSYQSTYAGFDFTSAWAPPNQSGQGGDTTAHYPELYATSHIAAISVSGTKVYGDANPALTPRIYGLRYYDGTSVIPLGAPSVNADANSPVGSYAISIGLTTLPAQIVGLLPYTQSPSWGGQGPTWLNFGPTGYSFASSQATAQQAVGHINAAYGRTIASLDSLGRIVLTQTNNTSSLYFSALQGYYENNLHLPGGALEANGNGYKTTVVAPRPGTPTSNDGTNYRIVYLPSALTVTPRPLTVTPTSNQSKVYGNADPALTYSITAGNLVNGNTLSGSLGRAAGENAGAYSINLGSLGVSSNYAITLASANFTIDKRTLTVGLTGNVAKQYNGTNIATLTSGNYTLTNVLSADASSLSVANLPTSGTYDNANAGTGKTVTVNLNGVLSGAAANNYTLAATASGAIGTITQVPLTITAGDQSKTYGDALALGTTAFSKSGTLYGSDSITGVALASLGAVATAGVSGSPYAITASNATGVGIGNYAITYIGGQLTVNPAQITVTAAGGSSIYGDNPTNPGVTAVGLKNNEGVGVLTGLTNTFGIDNATNAGGYTLSVDGTLTNGNYTIVNRNTGIWTVNPAEIAVTATGGSSIYGDNPTNPGFTASGLKNGQGVDALTGLYNSFGITNLTNAGDHTLSVGGTLTNGNYTIVNRNTGTWTVNPAEIIVTATGGSSIYGDSSTNPGFTASGLKNSQTVAVLTGLANSFGITNLTNAGDHTLGVDGTLTNGNYTIVNRNTGTWTVNPAEITVTATGGSSVYGDNPANPGFTATGLKNGQTVAVLTGLANSFGITALTDAGDHTLSVDGTLANGNYTITNRYTNTWTVNPAEITVTANGGSSIYGDSSTNPGFTATGLKNSQTVDVLTGLANSFGITSFTNAGDHTLSVDGTLTNGNYTITNRYSNTWTVNPAEIVVTALGGTSVYGQNPANPGISASGLKNGEGVDILTGLANSFGIDGTTGVGGNPYLLSVTGALTNGNYSITTRNTGNWIITPAPVTVTADILTKMFTDPDPALTYLITSGQLYNGDTFTGGLARVAGEATGTYAINQNTLALSPNYTLTYVGSLLTIEAFDLKGTPSSSQSNGSAPPGGQNSVAIPSAPTPVATPVNFGTSQPRNAGPQQSAAISDPTTTGTISGEPGGKTPQFVPISMFDKNHYSDGTLPADAAQMSEETVFTMLARGILQDSAWAFIDRFAAPSGVDWSGAEGTSPLSAKATFSDGAGQTVVPDDMNAFAIVAGTTDFTKMLGNGPVVIGGTLAPSGSHWMLAIGLTADGTGIIANDPISGQRVELAYDPATRTIGGIVKIFDPKAKDWLALSDANATQLAGDISLLADQFAALRGFTPGSYYAVTVK